MNKKFSDAHVLPEHMIDNWQDIFRNLLATCIIAITVWFITTFVEVIVISWIKIFNVIPFAKEMPIVTHYAHDKADKVFEFIHMQNVTNIKNFLLYPHSELAFLLFFMLLGALIRSMLLSFKTWQDAIGNGVSETWEYFHHSYVEQKAAEGIAIYPKTTFGRTLRRICMTVLTLCSGGSGGLEGPIIPIGESISSGFAKLFRIKTSHNLQLYQIVGVASGLTALLNAPFTSAIFASEMFLPEKMIYRFIIYSLFASVIVYTLNIYSFGSLHHFIIEQHSKYYSFKEFALISMICIFFSAPAGLALAKTQQYSKTFFNRVPTFFRPLLGAILLFFIVAASWLFLNIEPYHIIGMGEQSLIQILNDDSNNTVLQIWWIVLLLVFIKMIATSITLNTGGSVGLLIPAMYMGGMTGYGVFLFLDKLHFMNASAGSDLYIISGIVSALVTIVDIPLASIAFVIEIFGANYGPPAIISVVICYKIASRLKK